MEPHKDLLQIEDLSKEEIESILAAAQPFKELFKRSVKKVPTLQGKTVLSLFYEPSTRTSSSFEVAANRLSADFTSLAVATSSVVKGESVLDTVDTLGAMKFPSEYREGIVRVENPRECLDPDLAVPSEHKLRNPHIRFFIENNKEYLRGDEMVCLTEFTLANTKRTAQQIAGEVLGSLDSRASMRREVAVS